MSTIRAPATAAAIRQPNSLTAEHAHAQTDGPLAQRRVDDEAGLPVGRALGLDLRRAALGAGLHAVPQQVLRVADVVDLVEDPATRDVEPDHAQDAGQQRDGDGGDPAGLPSGQPVCRRQDPGAPRARRRRGRGRSGLGSLERRGHGCSLGAGDAAGDAVAGASPPQEPSRSHSSGWRKNRKLPSTTSPSRTSTKVASSGKPS
jgi:hypothetical protein